MGNILFLNISLNILVHYFHRIFPLNNTTKQSFTFIEENKQLNTYGKFLIYFDVNSLFANIPLAESINIAIETIFEN